MIKLGDAMNYHVDLNQTWQTAKFIILHMIQTELLVAFVIAAICSWHLANLLAKHNNRLSDAVFSRRISYACMLLMVICVVLRQILK